MKKFLFLAILLTFVSVLGFSAEQTFTLKPTGIRVGMGIVMYSFEILDGPYRGGEVYLCPTSELYKSVLERYITPTSRVIIKLDVDSFDSFSMDGFPLSCIVSIDGRPIETLFR